MIHGGIYETRKDVLMVGADLCLDESMPAMVPLELGKPFILVYFFIFTSIHLIYSKKQQNRRSNKYQICDA